MTTATDPRARTTHPIARELLTAERDRHAEWLAGDWSSRTASGQNAAARHSARLAAVHAELDRLDDEDRALADIAAILYPDADPDAEWSSDELPEVVGVLIRAGYAPADA